MHDDTEKTSIDPVRAGLGMRLASARKGKKLTQDQVADRFSVNKATVSAWETGRGVPDAIRLRELAKLYDVSADSLLWEDSLTPEAMKFAAEFDSLSEAQKRTLHAIWMAYIRETATDERVNHIPPAPTHELDSDFGGLEPAKPYRGKQLEPFHPAGKPSGKSRKEG